MPTAVTCDGCGKSLSVKDEYIGRLLKCPQCGVKFTATADTDDGPDRAQHLVDRLVAQWPVVAGLAAMAAGLVLLMSTRSLMGAGMIRRAALGLMGLGIASIGYWALNSNNRDYNF